MKKSVLLVLSSIVLSGCAGAATLHKKADRATLDNSAINSAVASFFSGSYRISSDVRNLYTEEQFRVIDEVSSTAKKNEVISLETNQAIKSTHIVSEGGFAVEQYLDYSNSIKTRPIGNGRVLFSDFYGSPLVKVAGSSALLEQYFSISQSSDGYLLKANAKGLSKAASNFSEFFAFHGDEFLWDATSTKTGISELSISTDSSGIPTKLNFIKTKWDKFGGIKVSYDSTLETIAAVSDLSTYQSSMDAIHKVELSSAIANLGEKIAVGNFTETIVQPYVATYVQIPEYHNYYQFDGYGYGVMLSDLPYEAAGYGITYMGIALNEMYGYYLCAVSPEANYFGITMQEYKQDLSECLPSLYRLSPEFFEYEEGKYVFDMDKCTIDDFYFSVSILDAIFGGFEPSFAKWGYFLSNIVTYTYELKKMTIEIDEDNIPSFELDYVDFIGNTVTAKASFSDFGTTDLTKNDTLKQSYQILMA